MSCELEKYFLYLRFWELEKTKNENTQIIARYIICLNVFYLRCWRSRCSYWPLTNLTMTLTWCRREVQLTLLFFISRGKRFRIQLHFGIKKYLCSFSFVLLFAVICYYNKIWYFGILTTNYTLRSHEIIMLFNKTSMPEHRFESEVIK